MKYVVMFAVVSLFAGSAFASSFALTSAGSALGSFASSQQYKNVDEAQAREEAIKANLDEQARRDEQDGRTETIEIDSSAYQSE